MKTFVTEIELENMPPVGRYTVTVRPYGDGVVTDWAPARDGWQAGTPPVQYADYLCWWLGCGYVRILRYHPSGWGPDLAPVTHWQPLPVPPEAP